MKTQVRAPLPTTMTDLVNFDGLATSEVDSRVMAVMEPWLSLNSSPTSLHPLGQATANLHSKVRSQIAQRIGCNSEEVIFTGSCAQADNIALKGFARSINKDDVDGRMAIMASDSLSCLNSARAIEKHGWDLDILQIDGEGVLDLTAAEQILGPATKLVSCHLANEETGAIQPIEQLVKLVRNNSPQAIIHCNARAAFGRFEFNFADLGIDSLSFEAKSIAGPMGCGVLILKAGSRIAPSILGGDGSAPLDTPNLANAQIAGLGATCELVTWKAGITTELIDAIAKSKLGKRCWTVSPEMCVEGIINLCMDGVSAEPLVVECGINGLLISPSSGCTASAGKASHVLSAMGISTENALSTIRISINPATTVADIHKGVTILEQSYSTLTK